MTRLGKEDARWLERYATEVVAHFRPRFEASQLVFPAWQKLMDRFSDAINVVRSKGRQYFRSVDEAHNELCVATSLLSITEDKLKRLSYEPPLPQTDKTIDFMATFSRLGNLYIDVKTIKPLSKNKWSHFDEQIRKGRFPANLQYLLSKEWLGGELWHYAYAARSKMLEYTLELEEKIGLVGASLPEAQYFLMLCGEGFYWHMDELEDFVHFYRTGTHRADDAFAIMEKHCIKEQGISLSGQISAFSCIGRAQGALCPKKIVWRTAPPNDDLSRLT